jgi:replicative DNA helicase
MFKNYTTLAKYDIYKQLKAELKLQMVTDGFLPKEEEFELIPLSESFDEATEYLKNPDKIDGLSTGYQKLDECTGGFAPEELIVLSGGTGEGKTQISQCIIINMVLDNNPVLFFTLEMPPRETTIRFMKIIKSKYVEEVMRELPIHYYHGTNATLPILERAIEKGIEKGIKCVVIDHLHFFAKNNDNQAAEIGNITREIKLMARKFHIPIILIAHIRKTGSPGKVPGLEDLKDSSSIAQDADTVLMAHRNLDDGDMMMKLAVKKNRRKGILKTIWFEMDDNTYLREGKYYESDRGL